MIQITPFLRDNNEDKKALVVSLLTSMNKNEVLPNIGTLNACLKACTSLNSQDFAQEFALSIIAEFKAINIEPSLGSYYYMLNIFCQKGTEIMNLYLQYIIKNIFV